MLIFISEATAKEVAALNYSFSWKMKDVRIFGKIIMYGMTVESQITRYGFVTC